MSRGLWGVEAQLTGPRLGLSRPRVKHNSESERRSPSSEDDREERESTAEIQNLEDYKEIFQPKNSISELGEHSWVGQNLRINLSNVYSLSFMKLLRMPVPSNSVAAL